MQTQITNQEKALIAKRFLDFYRAHPEWRLEANTNLIQGWCDQKMLSTTIAENLEIAALALYSQLATRAKPEPESTPEPEPEPPPAAPRFNDPYWDKEQLKRALRNEFPTKEQILRERDEKIKALRLPAEYTIQKLKKMSAQEIRKLARDTAQAAGLGADQEAGLIAVDNRLGGVN
jgi:hypothetical protein